MAKQRALRRNAKGYISNCRLMRAGKDVTMRTAPDKRRRFNTLHWLWTYEGKRQFYWRLLGNSPMWEDAANPGHYVSDEAAALKPYNWIYAGRVKRP